MDMVHTCFGVAAGTAVQALMELSERARSGTDDPALADALARIGDPTGKTWHHLLGLCLEIGPPRALGRLVEHIDAMDPMEFRLTLLGHNAWSWRSIVGADVIEAAARGDDSARARLLADDRYYAGLAAEALPTVLSLDTESTKSRFRAALSAYAAGTDVELRSTELDTTERRIAALADAEGWLDAIELTCGYRYLPEPEARRVVVMPHLAGPGLLLAQHHDARLIVHGESPAKSSSAHLVEIGRALSDESRVRLLHLLAQRPAQLGELVDTTGLTRSTVHHHLRQLREAGLVAVEGNARAYRYAINPRGRCDTITALSDLLGITQKGRNIS